jgi:hypothetical protein
MDADLVQVAILSFFTGLGMAFGTEVAKETVTTIKERIKDHCPSKS